MDFEFVLFFFLGLGTNGVDRRVLLTTIMEMAALDTLLASRRGVAVWRLCSSFWRMGC